MENVKISADIDFLTDAAPVMDATIINECTNPLIQNVPVQFNMELSAIKFIK